MFFSRKSDSWSAGYTSVFTPVNNFPLRPFNKYQIKFENSNQGGPENYSAMPQSFFAISDFDPENPLTGTYYDVDTAPENYIFDGYDEADIKINISEHNKINIMNSNNIINPADEIGLIPSPVSIQKIGKGIRFSAKTKVTYGNSDSDSKIADMLITALNKDLHLKLSTTNFKEDLYENYIKISTLNDGKIIKDNPEGYVLTIKDGVVQIEALNEAGKFYAFQTLRFLWNKYKGKIPGMIVTDYPRYKYRGVLLDVARHFFSVSEIKSLIDSMAVLKINTLHVHFSDDEGWRIKLEELPELSRGETRGFACGSQLTPVMFQQADLVKPNYKNFDPHSKILIRNDYPKANTAYSGSYSIAQLKDIIAYANERQVTIIPEIDLPGHARALIYSMPEVFIDKNDKSEYISVQGYIDDVLPVHIYNKATEQGKLFTETINKIVKSIAEIFSGQKTLYALDNEISIGGDEVAVSAWSNDNSPDVKWKKLAALEKTHHFFYQLQKGTAVKMSGWQKFVPVNGGKIKKELAVTADNTGRVWIWEPSGNGIDQAVELAKMKYQVVLTFADNTYFDLAYTPDKWEPGFSWAGKFLDTNAVLISAANSLKTENKLIEQNKDKNKGKASAKQESIAQKVIIGIEGCLWSENLISFKQLNYMAFPKMTGLSEASWAPVELTVDKDSKVNWKSLIARLGEDNKGYLGYLNSILGIFYRGYPNGISEEIK